ncbi:DNA primase [Bacteroidales bacterium OttesenSCG-928-B11]|nr:DNA primase [Bacteroidales bacterium OttesenSCG-928-C03]MDL2312645.1 DNA primase [Bacteroidales bacterium OttesenSCG-928-B11]MDL2326116.1 DNA primase [Bacteroidales bacterium OttesenSCG-928-A14]
MIDKSKIDEVLMCADMLSVVKDAGVKMRQSGGWLHVGKCPFHTEKSGSFFVNVRNNRYNCYGCGESGNAISFLMKMKGLTFTEAVHELAKKHNITIKEYTPTKEEEQTEKLRRDLLQLNEAACDFFSKQLEDNPQAKAYALSRFSKDTVSLFKLGYAPDSRNALYMYLRHSGYSMEFLEKSDLFRKRKDGGLYDFFRNRLIFPIFDISNHIVGFSGRYLGNDEKTPKYLNSTESPVYSKGNVLFALNFAHQTIRKNDCVVLVEGYADAVKLHELGIHNTASGCGTALTDGQIGIASRFSKNMVLLYDSDPAGQEAAVKNGRKICEAGHNAYTLTIPPDKAGQKQDPDSFFTSKEQFDQFLAANKESFFIRLAKQKAAAITDVVQFPAAIKDVARLFLSRPESERSNLVEHLSKVLPTKSVWTKVLKELDKEKRAEKETRQLSMDGRTDEQNKCIEKYGFYVEKNCYYFYASRGGGFYQGSNFIMEPLFHIISTVNAKRLYRVRNEFGIERVLEFTQKDLISIAAFRLKCESVGNFRFDSGEFGLNKIKGYLYEHTKTCKEILQMGWQNDGFFAWANGISTESGFTPVSEIGVVEHGKENYYIPALSSLYETEANLYQFERKFQHTPGETNLIRHGDTLFKVYGDNAVAGLCFYIATLFRDVIVSTFRFFPILNVFGPKGTGKSELAVSLLKLFGDLPVGLNMTNSTIAAMADHVSHTKNALCHIDEYKNSVEYDKIEFLKGLWDGVGRSRMNMEKDRKKEMTAVDCGIILTGQEMTTADNALFSRVIFLSFTKTKFTDREKEDFEEMKKLEKKGLTQITHDLLQFRTLFTQHYVENYNAASEEILEYVEKSQIEDRILKNWLILLAAYRTLRDKISLPLSYSDTVRLFARMIERQNKEVFAGNEVSDFWNIYQELFSSGLIEKDYDLQIKDVPEFKNANKHIQRHIKILYMNPIRIFSLYAQTKKNNQEKKLPKDSLQYYLQNSEEFLGTQQRRFRKPLKNLQDREAAMKMPGDGTVAFEYERPYAWCFDYEKLAERMGLNMETEYIWSEELKKENNEDNDSNDITDYRQGLPELF